MSNSAASLAGEKGAIRRNVVYSMLAASLFAIIGASELARHEVQPITVGLLCFFAAFTSAQVFSSRFALALSSAVSTRLWGFAIDLGYVGGVVYFAIGFQNARLSGGDVEGALTPLILVAGSFALKRFGEYNRAVRRQQERGSSL